MGKRYCCWHRKRRDEEGSRVLRGYPLICAPLSTPIADHSSPPSYLITDVSIACHATMAELSHYPPVKLGCYNILPKRAYIRRSFLTLVPQPTTSKSLKFLIPNNNVQCSTCLIPGPLGVLCKWHFISSVPVSPETISMERKDPTLQKWEEILIYMDRGLHF